MIKIKDGTLHVEGTRLDLISEFMCITDSMLKKGIISKEKLMTLITLLCVPEDELKSIVIDEIDKMDNIGEALDLLYRLG